VGVQDDVGAVVRASEQGAAASSSDGPVARPVLRACQDAVARLARDWELPSIYLLVDGRLRCMAASGYFQVVDGFTPGSGVIGRSVRTASTVVVADATLDPEFVAAIPGLRSEVCAPVVLDGTCVGAVSLESREVLPDGAVVAAEQAAADLAGALRDLGGMPPTPIAQRLARLAVSMSAESDVEVLRRMTVEGVAEVSGRSSAALSLVDAVGGWETCAVTGPLSQALSSWEAEDLALVARWVEAGTSSHFPGGAGVPPEYGFLHRSGVRTIGVQPLVAGGVLMGVLAVADAEPHPHDPAVVATIELFASLAASCLRTATLLGDLAQRAVRDALTGLRDAGEFEADLARACGAAAATGEVLATCVLLDVDNFKVVNDTQGHPAGDEVLRSLAKVLGTQLRESDGLYRVGGDEFAVLLGTGADERAHGVAERLVSAAAGVGVPVSLGWALVEAGPAEVRAAADRALYEAKHAGRGTHRRAHARPAEV
jgi:diguanylate cyclase (GGDEF)-like protein